jgi:polyisoprenoid-binding protein YceI
MMISSRFATVTALLGIGCLLPGVIGATSFSADPAQSRLEFNFVQAGARNSGQFKEFTVRFDAHTQSGGGSLEVIIDTRSLDTQDADRDAMLRSGYFFESDFHPYARFKSVQIVATGNGSYEANGRLTIRETTRDITLPFTMDTASETQGPRLHGSLTVRRLDYGVGQGDWRATTWIRNDVNVSFDVRLSADGD